MNISLWFGVVFAEAFACSGMLFAAHAAPLNRDHIEPGMAKGKLTAYAAGFVYYAAALALPIAILHLVFGLL